MDILLAYLSSPKSGKGERKTKQMMGEDVQNRFALNAICRSMGTWLEMLSTTAQEHGAIKGEDLNLSFHKEAVYTRYI